MICTSQRWHLTVTATLAFFTFAGLASAQERWVGTWAAAPLAAPNTAGELDHDRTLREIVHVSLGGSKLRIVLSNEFGAQPLTVGGAEVALSTGGGTVQGGHSAAVSFSGQSAIVIPAGALAISDPVDLKLPALSDLAVSLFLPTQKLETLTVHPFADCTNYEASGNQTTAASLAQSHEVAAWRFLKGVDVDSSTGKGARSAIVTFGDSITDGAHSSRDANARWPDVLARRLQADKSTAALGILNEGIGGNRILHDGAGPDALARFDRDVIAQAGVKYLVVMEGINDIGHALDPNKPYDVITAQDLIAGLSQMAARAHLHGIKIFGATLTPYVGAGYSSPGGEAVRQTVNQWIRTSKELDGVIDFDKATNDPAHPGVFLPADDSGDHLHPSDGGYKAMGDAIDLKLFTR